MFSFPLLYSTPACLLILALGIAGLILFIERLLFLHKGQIRAASFLTGIKNLLRKHRLLEALTVCEETPGPVAQVVKIALLAHDQPEAVLRGEVERCALLQMPLLSRRLSSLAMISKVAPLIGLLGVLLAFLQGFLQMEAEGPYAQISLFSAYIIAGILAMSLGIGISILAHIGHHFLNGRLRAIAYDIEWAGSDIIQFLIIEKIQEAPSSTPALPEENL